MALLDIFKKKPIRQAQGKEKKEVHEVKPSAMPKAESKPPLRRSEARPVRLGGKKILGQAYRILKGPQVTEKATDSAIKNQYIFKVFSDANKNQIKKAVEDVYGADVVSVNIVNIPRKRRRLGRIQGWRGGYKKAIVKIKEGQKIEVLPR